MDLGMQAKLLKAIDEKRIMRIGGFESKKVDVRILAAINEPPDACIGNHRMRSDLFYRLSSIQIKVPALREHKSDIEVLTRHFVNYYNREMKMQIEGVSDAVLAVFHQYDWPGNVREFKNVIESAFNFGASSVIRIEDLPDDIRRLPSLSPSPESHDTQEIGLKEAMDRCEKAFIEKKAASARNLTALADTLNISKQTLNYKLRKYNIAFRAA